MSSNKITAATQKQKLVVVLGPTASGKSDLAVTLAKKFNGEVISADSRQVYRGMDIGTGKITKSEMRGVVHHLLDVADPKRTFSVAMFKKRADRAIVKILNEGKIPILCGGTGFYIQAVVDDLLIPEVKADTVLRRRLDEKSTKELVRVLRIVDPRRARTIDKQNRRRLIRAIEVAVHNGPVKPLPKKPKSKYDLLEIGIKTKDEVLRKRIHDRLHKRMRSGMLAEAKRLHTNGVSWKRMDDLGLEYRFLAEYLQKQKSKGEMLEGLGAAIWGYARRQKTWFRRDQRIEWFELNDEDKIVARTAEFLKK